jgi:putative NIF3 family GTP cyclohydrolase 1 type 2
VKPANPTVGHPPRRCGKLERFRRPVQIANQRTRGGMDNAFAPINFDSFHSGQIDHQTVLTHAETRAAMTSSSHCQRQVPPLGKFEGSGDI